MAPLIYPRGTTTISTPMPPESRRILVDTSAFAALANRKDNNHLPALELLNRLRAERLQPFTTSFVVSETHALLLRRLGHVAAREWLQTLPILEVWVSEDDYARGKQIVMMRRDKAYSLTDAISFVVMKRLGTRLAFSLDDHFDQHGLERLLP